MDNLALPRLTVPVNLDGIEMPEGLQEQIINLNANEKDFDLLVVAGTVIDHGLGKRPLGRTYANLIVNDWWRTNVTSEIYEVIPRWCLARWSITLRQLEDVAHGEPVPGPILDRAIALQKVANLVCDMSIPDGYAQNTNDEGSSSMVEDSVVDLLGVMLDKLVQHLEDNDYQVDLEYAPIATALVKDRDESPLPDERFAPLWWEKGE